MKEYLYILTPAIAWAVAQGLKHVFVRYNRRRKVIDQPDTAKVLLPLAPSGGMPSAHTATVVGLASIVGLGQGFDSPVFAIAVCLAAIVMYDAVMVRYSSGEQGEAILSILDHLKSGIKRPKVAKGHLLSEVVVGAVIGLVTSTVLYIVVK